MKIKRIRALFCALTLPLLACACSTEVQVTAHGNDGALISFHSAFSRTAEQTLRSIIGALSGSADSDAPLLHKDDIVAFLRQAGLQNVTASLPSPRSVSASGTLPAVSETLSRTGMVRRTAHSLTFALGAAEIKAWYALLDEEAQAYFDLLMIPALQDETMTVAEYQESLASVYGPSFASEVTAGTLSLTLASPDGKKRKTVAITLGELLSLHEQKTWSVDW